MTEATKGRKGKEQEEKGPRVGGRSVTSGSAARAREHKKPGVHFRVYFFHGGRGGPATITVDRSRTWGRRDRAASEAKMRAEEPKIAGTRGSARAANTTRFGRWSAHVATFTCSVDRALSASIYDSLYRAIPPVICP